MRHGRVHTENEKTDSRTGADAPVRLFLRYDSFSVRLEALFRGLDSLGASGLARFCVLPCALRCGCAPSSPVIRGECVPADMPPEVDFSAWLT